LLVSGSQQDELDAQLKKLNQKGMKSRVQELMLQDDVLFAKTKASLYGDQSKQSHK
jgi:TPP-dependent 2-oxoacid decarboxylase